MCALEIERDEEDTEGFCTEGVEGREGVGEGDGGVVTHILHCLLVYIPQQFLTPNTKEAQKTVTR